MKKFFLPLMCLVLGLTGYAQSPRYLEAKALLRESGYTIYDEKTYSLKKGQKASYTRQFYSSSEYVIVGLSDDGDVSDIDIKLYETSGELYKKDTATDAVPWVSFDPSVSRSMKIEVLNYDTSTPNYASPIRLIVAGK